MDPSVKPKDDVHVLLFISSNDYWFALASGISLMYDFDEFDNDYKFALSRT